MIAREIPLPLRAAHFLLNVSLRSLWKIEDRGLEFVPRTGRVILAANHLHWLDPILVGLIVYRVRLVHFLAKEELFRMPIFGWMLRQAEAIPLNRSRADFSAVRSAVEVLEKEGCMVLFPEGTRARQAIARKPRPGVGFLARQTGAPVVPARISNTQLFPSRVTLRIRFGAPVRYEGGATREEYQQFADHIMEQIFHL